MAQRVLKPVILAQIPEPQGDQSAGEALFAGKMATDEGAAAATHGDAAAAAPVPAAGRHEFAESLPDHLLDESARKLIRSFLFGEQAKEAHESQAAAEEAKEEPPSPLIPESAPSARVVKQLQEQLGIAREALAKRDADVVALKEQLRREREETAGLRGRLQAAAPTGPSLSILAFNALKLRIDDPNINWDPVLRAFAEYDAVIMSEITESSGPGRVEKLIARLRDKFGATFNVFFSRPSGATAKKASAAAAATSAAAPESAAAPKLSKSKVNNMKVAELRAALAELKLDTKGERSVLLKRLLKSGAVGEGNQEHHVILVKKSLKVVATKTTEKIRNISMDYAPFSVLLHVPHFKKDVQYVCLTSVHLPPQGDASRRDQHRQQARALFSGYLEDVALGQGWEPTSDSGTDGSYVKSNGIPFFLKGAKDAGQSPVSHITAGDYNANRSKLIENGASDKNGWHVVLGDAVKTSAGDKAYDNFVISKETTSDAFVVSPNVYELPLACPRRGEQGASDHKLVGLRLTETIDRKA